jgi:hypothetical protein
MANTTVLAALGVNTDNLLTSDLEDLLGDLVAVEATDAELVAAVTAVRAELADRRLALAGDNAAFARVLAGRYITTVGA